MRIVTFRKIKDFSEKNKHLAVALNDWYHRVRKAEWASLSDIKKDFRTVDYVGNNRYVFNIKGNHYRLVAIVIFASKKMYIRFIGPHNAYDKIDCKTI